MKKIAAIILACTAVHLQLFSMGCFHKESTKVLDRSIDGTVHIAYSNSGQFAAALDSDECTVSLYRKNQGSDSLELLQRVETSSFPFFAAFSPDDSYAVVTNQIRETVGENGITVYRIDSETGKWQLMQTITVSEMDFPYSISYSPDGRFVAVTNLGGNCISVYRVSKVTGELSLLNRVPSGSAPNMLVFSPDGRFLAVTKCSTKQISIYRVDSRTAALTEIADSPFSVEGNPEGISYQCGGACIAITNSGDDSVVIYEVNEVTGALSSLQSTKLKGDKI